MGSRVALEWVTINSQTAADLLDTFVGDTDLDGDVDSADLVLLVNNFGSSVGDWANRDLDNNGVVDAADLGQLISNLGSTGGNNNQTNPIQVIEHLFGYTGRMFDNEIGLQNNLNRWYDPVVGRWISQDPIGFAAADANLYRYVRNQSTTATDPTGLFLFPPLAGAGGIVVGGSTTVGGGSAVVGGGSVVVGAAGGVAIAGAGYCGFKIGQAIDNAGWNPFPSMAEGITSWLLTETNSLSQALEAVENQIGYLEALIDELESGHYSNPNKPHFGRTKANEAKCGKNNHARFEKEFHKKIQELQAELQRLLDKKKKAYQRRNLKMINLELSIPDIHERLQNLGTAAVDAVCPTFVRTLKVVLDQQARGANSSDEELVSLCALMSEQVPQDSAAAMFGRIYAELALYCRLNEHITDAIDCYELAITHAYFANDQIGEANLHTNLGDLYLTLDRLEAARFRFSTAATLRLQNDDLAALANSASSIGVLLYNSGDFGLATDAVLLGFVVETYLGDDFNARSSIRNLEFLAKESGSTNKLETSVSELQRHLNCHDAAAAAEHLFRRIETAVSEAMDESADSRLLVNLAHHIHLVMKADSPRSSASPSFPISKLKGLVR